MNLLGAYEFNFERLHILQDSIGHSSKKLLSFKFAQSFRIQFWASQYIMGPNRTSEKKDIVVWIFLELRFSIPGAPIYLGTQSNIRVKSYCCLSFVGDYIFNFERLDILQHSIRHPSKKLLLFEFSRSFRFQFLASPYITELNRTFE